MIFIDNKYSSIYYKIIERAKSRIISGYVEKHHVIPKSLGGTNDKNNIVKLTAREHFICHLLLTKMTSGEKRKKMLYAVFYLTGSGKAKERHNILKGSRLFQSLREEYALHVSKQKKGCKQPPRTAITRKKLSDSKTGKLNPRYKGTYITPWGIFPSSRLAAAACPKYITANCINNFCTLKNQTPVSYLSICRSKGWLQLEHVGQTPYQLGFELDIA